MDRIVHSTAVDIGGGRRGFRSKDTVAGQPGTVLTATHLNAEQEEIVGFIEATGQEPSGDHLNQLTIGVRSQALNFIPEVGGAANALTAALDPALTAYTEGLQLSLVTGAAANTGAMTVNFGPGAVDLVNFDDAAILEGEVPAASFLTMRFDGSKFRLTHPAPRTIAPFFRMFTPADDIPHNVPTVVTGYAGQEANGLRDSVLSLAAGTITIGTKDAGVWVFTAVGKIELGAETQISDLRKNSLPIASGSVEITGLGNLFWNHPSSTVITRCAPGDVIAFAFTHKSTSGIVQRMAQMPYVQFSGARIR